MARRTTTRYQIVAQDLRSKIADQRLKPGDKIPSLTELQAEYGVSDTVILEARKVLAVQEPSVVDEQFHWGQAARPPAGCGGRWPAAARRSRRRTAPEVRARR
ncbi:GntR family transcriptional regulator [Streptomyces goshikiensis]|uniref:GntR family transcriptional regulator n=1 Tax=Streptomyces goshikiensis TaxID=1942 RepID=UPI00368FCC5B